MNKKNLFSITLVLVLILIFIGDVKSQEMVKISGKINNYNGNSSNPKSIAFSTDELFVRGEHFSIAEVKRDGSFESFVPLYQPQYIHFKYQKQYSAFAKPGDKISIFLDDQHASKPIVFEGDGANFNNINDQFNSELDKHFTGKHTSHLQNNEEVKNNPELAKQWYLDSLSQSLDFLEAFAVNNKLGQTDRERIKAKLEYSTASKLIAFGKGKSPESNLEDLFKQFPIDPSETSFSAIGLEYLDEYYKFLLQTIDKNQYVQLPNAAEVALMYLEFNHDLSDSERSLLMKFSSPTASDSNLDHNDTIQFQNLFESNRDLFEEKFPPKHPWIEYFLSETDAPVRDVFLSWTIVNLIRANYLEVVKPYLNTYSSVVENEILKNSLIGYYNEHEKLMYPNTVSSDGQINFREIPKPNGESLLNEILASYHGKVVYIDFWGTWCAPCLAEMPASRKLKEELNGQNVVFLYLGVDSPENKWKQLIAKLGIQGEHYLLNNEEFGLLQEQYQIQGVPRYMLVDKNGIVHDKDAMRPSVPDLKDKIIQLAEK